MRLPDGGAVKIIPIIILIIFLLLALWAVQGFRRVEAPDSSTTETQTNSSQDAYPLKGRSVTQGNDPDKDTVPSPTGSGANTLLEP